MKDRRRAREVALQALFQYDQNPDTLPETIREFVSERLQFPKLETFALRLIEGVRSNRDDIDAMLAQVAKNWSVSRMAPIDRNILRLAVFELRFDGQVPPKVAINEALEICKRFSGGESVSFVNGILDRIAHLPTGNPAPPPETSAEESPSPLPPSPPLNGELDKPHE